MSEYTQTVTWADLDAEDRQMAQCLAFEEEDGAEDDEIDEEDVWADAFEGPSPVTDDDDEWDDDSLTGDADVDDDLPDPP